MAQAVLGSVPLKDDDLGALRLPFPITITYFSRPLLVPEEIRRHDPTFQALPDTVDVSLLGVCAQEGALDQPALTFDLIYAMRQGGKAGMGLFRTYAPGGQGHEGTESLIGTMLQNVAAFTVWGDWHPPQGPVAPLPSTAKDVKQALRAGPPRKLLEQWNRVHVVDIHRLEDRVRTPPTTTRSRPREHPRRGYYYRRRTGSMALPKEERGVTRAFVPPTTINLGIGERRDPAVWELPVTLEILATISNVRSGVDSHSGPDGPGTGPSMGGKS